MSTMGKIKWILEKLKGRNHRMGWSHHPGHIDDLARAVPGGRVAVTLLKVEIWRGLDGTKASSTPASARTGFCMMKILSLGSVSELVTLATRALPHLPGLRHLSLLPSSSLAYLMGLRLS